MKKAIVIGSGAGGATVAKELQGKFHVTVLEAGKEFRPFSYNLSLLEKLRRTGLFFDEREIQLLFPAMKIRKTDENMVLVNGIGTGGTTTICAGNALRMDHILKQIGIYLDDEFKELDQEIPISTAHQKRWRQATKRLFEICQDMGLNPKPTPKMGNYDVCINCGRCVLGCPQGAKWDSRHFLNNAIASGAQLITNCHVEKIIIENGMAKGVQVRKGMKKNIFYADLIIIAAGGFATPLILQNSGIKCQSLLFVDPVLCVATEWQDALQNKEVSMPFVVQCKHFILSPYFDYLSFFFNKSWRIPAKDVLSLMIKLADHNEGSISNKKIDKPLSETDKQRLHAGVDICTEILTRFGVKRENIFLGTINAGHPGGMLPLTEKESENFHHDVLPENVYVADATLLPKSLGNPPILTIMA
ncbi:MAG TPA: GMC family oxidoreductase N-terminal domain-containing protein, partial [bacterium]